MTIDVSGDHFYHDFKIRLYSRGTPQNGTAFDDTSSEPAFSTYDILESCNTILVVQNVASIQNVRSDVPAGAGNADAVV